jgi:hypothetical protein
MALSRDVARKRILLKSPAGLPIQDKKAIGLAVYGSRKAY